jgi:pimeloyl-ACP methyl ester carboxylesterase
VAWLERGNVKIYYEDVGEGEPIITTHGLMEDGGYWSETGITAKLAERYRVISMDMRGHGRTVVDGEPCGYDVATMGNDFGVLADELGLDRIFSKWPSIPTMDPCGTFMKGSFAATIRWPSEIL